MHYERSGFLSRCVTAIQKIVSHIRLVIRGALVQIARCVYVTRKGHHSVQFIVEISSIWRNL